MKIRFDDRLKSRSQLDKIGEYEPDILIHKDRDLQTQTGQQVRMNISSTRNVVEGTHISEKGYSEKDNGTVSLNEDSRDYNRERSESNISMKQRSTPYDQSRF